MKPPDLNIHFHAIKLPLTKLDAFAALLNHSGNQPHSSCIVTWLQRAINHFQHFPTNSIWSFEKLNIFPSIQMQNFLFCFLKKDLSLQNGYSCGHCTAKLLNEWSCKDILAARFKIVSIRLMHLKAASCKSPCYILPCPKCQRNNSLSKTSDRTIYNNDKCRLLSGKRTILEI